MYHHISRQIAEAHRADVQGPKPVAPRAHRLVSAGAFGRSPSWSPQ